MKAVKLIAAAALISVVAAGAALAGGHHRGMGPGGMGPGGMGNDGPCPGMEREKPLTADQAKDIVEGHIAMRGQDYKVSNVEDKGETLVVWVVKADGTLVHRVQFDKKSGRFRPVE